MPLCGIGGAAHQVNGYDHGLYSWVGGYVPAEWPFRPGALDSASTSTKRKPADAAFLLRHKALQGQVSRRTDECSPAAASPVGGSKWLSGKLRESPAENSGISFGSAITLGFFVPSRRHGFSK
jgi:hypothetical protein